MTRILIALAALLMTINLAANPVTLHVKNRPADEVFAMLMRQSGDNFVYDSKILKGLTLSLDADDESIDAVLERLFKESNITWRRNGHNIILQNSKPEKQEGKQTITISGFVRETGTQEALAGVRVEVVGQRIVTATNSLGFYSIDVPQRVDRLSFSYLGFEGQTIPASNATTVGILNISMKPQTKMLDEVEVVESVNRGVTLNAAEIGRLNISRQAIQSTPVIFGEADVIKTLQLEPGVSAGIEGMAGMYVHGGNVDENLYMLDNIPLYQVNHFGGLFSAFNVEALRNVDFYKSTFPARYDGRLSSYMDVRTKDGSMTDTHGSARLGLTSGAFNIDGPIRINRTSYSVAVRRSWYDVLTIPAFAIFNSTGEREDKTNLGYAFTDVNLKLNHRFSDKSNAHIMFYYGEDYLRTSESVDETRKKEVSEGHFIETKNNLRWGNIVASAGWNIVLMPKLFSEITGAYTRYSSRLKRTDRNGVKEQSEFTSLVIDNATTDNNIHDWIVKADFDWHPSRTHVLNFGLGYTHHSFLPSSTHRTLQTDSILAKAEDRITNYSANEVNAYLGIDWSPMSILRLNYGAHYSVFNISGHTFQNISPRAAFRLAPNSKFSIKGGYSRTVQYVHQLLQSSISLPTDQWVPVLSTQKPQTADKISAGMYYSISKDYTFSVEGYMKWMHNLLDYADEYYLTAPDVMWDSKLTAGRGTAKGIDFKISKDFGKFTGHIAYSLLWADRQYADKNEGKPFPARFDNRHKINIMTTWKINDKWEMSAAWTGMSGNRMTLPTQMWTDPELGPWHYDMTLKTDVNNYRLPFYHRLDIGLKRNTRNGYWDFSLYNAYCNMNTIAVRRDYLSGSYYVGMDERLSLKPVFQKIKLIPIIPSVSYTWLF